MNQRIRFLPTGCESCRIFALLLLTSFFLFGCQQPREYRQEMDETAYDIISDYQQKALGKEYDFTINRPSDILRHRVLIRQNLQITSNTSLGPQAMDLVEHWPEPNYPNFGSDFPYVVDISDTITLDLIDALQIAARNNFSYQQQKEDVFRSALALELERDDFRNTFNAQISSLISTNTKGSRAVSGTVQTGDFSVDRKLENGMDLSSSLAIDLANLLTMGGASSMGLAGDATVSIPLGRGSGRHIVTEPLVQAQRNVLYALWDFERFKREFVVDVASRYFGVLRQLDSVNNSEADYRSRIRFARRSRRLADAGRIKEIEVDQAVQNELSARQRWISATQNYKRQLDAFKIFLGLPPDANIELSPNDLKLLADQYQEMIDTIAVESMDGDKLKIPSAQAPVVLKGPDYKDAGPYEFDEEYAIGVALEKRMDLMSTLGKVFDAQRKVVVAADNLGAELTLFGSTDLGSRRTVTSADLEDARIRTSKGTYSATATLNLPFERTQESVNYRNSFITLERAVRTAQSEEDTIKSQIINTLRDLLLARENIYIQAKSVFVAQKRVKSVNMFLEAGRAQTRDLLEAQDALLSAQNAFTSAVVEYRIAELEIQRDMGILEVTPDGLWKEFEPEKWDQ